MHAAVRPFACASVALVGAGVIALAPVAPPPQALAPHVHVPTVQLPAVELSASVIDIFTFPAFQQFVLNQIDDLVTLGVGLGGSAAGLGQSIAMIPSTLVTATQQVLSGDLLGALTTVETYLVGSIVAIGEPTLAAIIERRQRVLAVQQALQVAVPEAFFDVVGGLGQGFDEVARAFIVAGQNLVDAVLSFSPGAIISALVDGTSLVVGSFVSGGQHVVDGIVSAQQTIATALAAQPAPVSTAEATDVPDLSRKTAMVAVSQSPDTDAATATASVEDATEVSSKDETPKADKDEPESKDSTSATADEPEDSAPKSPEKDDDTKPSDSPKPETAKSDNKSESEGAKQK